MDEALQIGQKIKGYRTARQMTARELASQAQITPSMLSQIERGQANPSLQTVRLLARALGVPLFRLFTGEEPVSGEVVRADQRRKISEQGVEFELLTPDTNGAVEMLLLTLRPGMESSPTFHSHAGEEVTFVMRGCAQLLLEGTSHALREGDSVRIKSGLAHRWRNDSDTDCVLVFAVTPPSF